MAISPQLPRQRLRSILNRLKLDPSRSRLLIHPADAGRIDNFLDYFGDFVLDTNRRELRRAEDHIPVEPQVFDLLKLLIRVRDRVVSRDELLDTIWRGRTVSDATLSSRVNAARTAVGYSGEAQR
jgi:DNA-binding winged helix-turn-helix (wHTH) protein